MITLEFEMTVQEEGVGTAVPTGHADGCSGSGTVAARHQPLPGAQGGIGGSAFVQCPCLGVSQGAGQTDNLLPR